MSLQDHAFIDLILLLIFSFLHLIASKYTEQLKKLLDYFDNTLFEKPIEIMINLIYFPIYNWFLIHIPFLIVLGWPIFSISILYWHLHYFKELLQFHFSTKTNNYLTNFYNKHALDKHFLPLFLCKRVFEQTISIIGKDNEIEEFRAVEWDGTWHKNSFGISLRIAPYWAYFLVFVINLYLKYPHDIARNNLLKFLTTWYYPTKDKKIVQQSKLEKLYILLCLLALVMLRLVAGLPLLTLRVSFLIVDRFAKWNLIKNSDSWKILYFEELFIDQYSIFKKNKTTLQALLFKFINNWRVHASKSSTKK